MADWFKCSPLPLLDALQDLSDDAALVFTKALLVIYHRDGRIPADALRSRFPRWRPKRLQAALTELLDKGRLFGTPTGHIHNRRAMHELAQLEEVTRKLSAAGEKGGRRKAERDRLARQIAERNLSPDLFDANATKPDFQQGKSNENNVTGQAPLDSARPRAREGNPTETQLNGGKVELNRLLTEVKPGNLDTKSNEINEIPLAPPLYARALEEELEIEKDSPVSPPRSEGETNGDEIELIEGTVESDDFTIPKRKPGKPIPKDWTPESAQLSESVTDLISEWPEGEYEREGVKFVEDAHSNDRRHRDWNRAFGVWLTKHDGYLQQRNRRTERASGWTHP